MQYGQRILCAQVITGQALALPRQLLRLTADEGCQAEAVRKA
jgi:hypothetical protein